MEIERKYLIEKEQLPKNLSDYPFHRIEQGYLCTSPVVRIRRQDDEYFLTYKSKGLMAREEYNLPLTQEAYEHLKPKSDGLVISKTRYLIPEKTGLRSSWMFFMMITRDCCSQRWNSHPRMPPTLTPLRHGSAVM